MQLFKLNLLTDKKYSKVEIKNTVKVIFLIYCGIYKEMFHYK